MGKQLRKDRHQAMIAVLVAAREKIGMTQRELCERLNRSHSFVGKIESGERQLNVLEFWEVAEILGVDPKKLFGKMVDSLPTHRQ